MIVFELGDRAFIVRVTPDFGAVVVMLSDGTREELVLHGDAERLGLTTKGCA